MERIRNAVLAEAKAKAEALVNQAKAEAAKQLQSSRDEIAAGCRRALDAAKARCDEEHRQRVGRLKAALRVELLDVKNQLIRKAFDEARKRLTALPKEDYLRLLTRWLKEAGGAAGGEVVVGPRDVPLFRNGFLAQVNATRPAGGKFTLASEPMEMAGGFVLRRRGFEIDMRLESQLSLLKDEALPEIAKILFGEETR